MKKYIVPGFMDYFGSVHGSLKDAKARAVHDRDLGDDMTGYYRVFGKHSRQPEKVECVEYKKVTRKEYLENEEKREKLEAAYEKAKAKLRYDMFHKSDLLRTQYVNFNTNYDYFDLIKMVIRTNGRKRTITGIVYSAGVTESGEIRPSLRGKTYPQNAEIVSIEVLKKATEMTKAEIYANS